MTRIAERLGTPGTVILLGVLVLVGVTVASVLLIRQSMVRSRNARGALDVAAVSDAGFTLLDAMERELGAVGLALVSEAPVDFDRITAQFDETDAALSRYSALVRNLTASIDDEIEPVRLDFEALEQVRTSMLSLAADEAATMELYDGFSAQIRQRLAELSLLATDADELRLRRASLSLVDAGDALSRRRTLLIWVAAGRTPLQPDTELQISLHSRDYSVGVANAAALLIGEDLDRVLAISSSPSAVSVNEAVSELLRDGTGSSSMRPDEWHDVTSRQLEEVMTVASSINDEIRIHASDRAGSARRMTVVVSTIAGALFVLVVLVAWSAVVASRGRVRALDDHRRLVDGLLGWFGAEARPDVDNVEIVARYAPAAVAGAGGDWYDVFRDHKGHLAIVIGDVAGHGADTVAAMAEVRNMIRAFASAGVGGPARQLELLDDTVAPTHLTTVLYAVVDVVACSLVYTRAGHVPGVIRRADGSTEILYESGDVPVGVKIDRGRSERVERFGTGDTLVLFTDGLVESPGVDVLRAIAALAEGVIAEAGDSISDLADRLMAVRPEVDNVDDASILIVRLTE